MQINFSIQPLDNNPVKTRFVEKSHYVQSKIKKETLESEPVRNGQLENLKNSLAEHNIALKFRQDEKTKQLVIELVDDKTGDTIRQIPSEVSLKLSRASVKTQGQFVDESV